MTQVLTDNVDAKLTATVAWWLFSNTTKHAVPGSWQSAYKRCVSIHLWSSSRRFISTEVNLIHTHTYLCIHICRHVYLHACTLFWMILSQFTVSLVFWGKKTYSAYSYSSVRWFPANIRKLWVCTAAMYEIFSLETCDLFPVWRLNICVFKACQPELKSCVMFVDCTGEVYELNVQEAKLQTLYVSFCVTHKCASQPKERSKQGSDSAGETKSHCVIWIKMYW